MRLFLFFPGDDDPWKLRMLSLLSWPLYGYSVARLSVLFTNRWMAMAFFLAMVLNPFLLFFFSLGRGYAAACACITFSLWLASERLTKNQPTPRHWLPVFVWACLAVLCNFTALYFLIGLCVVYLIYLYQHKGMHQLLRRAARPLLHIVLATICFSAASLLFIDLYSGDLEHGGKSNLPKSLFGSLLANSVYVKIPAAFKTVFGISVLGILMYSGLVGLHALRKTKIFNAPIFFILLMLLIVLLNFSFHLAFGIPYLLDRTTLIIFPLLTLFLFLFAKQLFWKLPGIVLVVVSGLIIILAGVNFIKSFSLKYFKEWRKQEHSTKAFDFLQKQKVQNVAMDVWQYSVLENYYRAAFPGRYRFSWSPVNYTQLSDTTGASLKNFDYVLLSAPDIHKDHLLAKWTVVMNDSLTGLTLFKRPAFSDTLPKKPGSSPK